MPPSPLSENFHHFPLFQEFDQILHPGNFPEALFALGPSDERSDRPIDANGGSMDANSGLYALPNHDANIEQLISNFVSSNLGIANLQSSRSHGDSCCEIPMQMDEGIDGNGTYLKVYSSDGLAPEVSDNEYIRGLSLLTQILNTSLPRTRTFHHVNEARTSLMAELLSLTQSGVKSPLMRTTRSAGRDDGHISAEPGPRPKLYEPPKRRSYGKNRLVESVRHEVGILFRSREGYGGYRNSKDVYAAFMGHLAQLKRDYERQGNTKSSKEKDDDQRARRLARRHIFIRHLTVECMSGDETGLDGKFYQTTVEWGSQESADFLSLLSAWYIGERSLGGGKYSLGELPRPQYS
ncbi:hypothetical protein C8R42DRAFT_644937 [Lentinula raphanica]|nr:hypothetical protein C8R42DRAFT_644937 [Lentinula raphanica]